MNPKRRCHNRHHNEHVNQDLKNSHEGPTEESHIVIDVERFAQEPNPGLGRHESKARPHQPNMSWQEVASGETGGIMPKCKNVLHHVMRRTRRPLAALGIATALCLGLAACVGTAAPKSSTTVPRANSIASTAPVADNVLGDAVVLGKVTDGFGTYEATSIDPKSKSMQYDATKIAKSAFDEGFTKETIQSAQQYIVKFIAEQALDSPAVDQKNSGWENWKSKVAPKYLLPSQSAALLNTNQANFDRPLLIINDPNNAVPQLVRDGKPRIANQTTVITAISGKNDVSVGNFLWVEGSSIVNYRVSDAEAQKSIMAIKNNASKTLADVKAEHPEFFDGKENVMLTTFTWQYAVVKVAQGNWLIGGYNNTISTNLQQ